MYFLEELEAQGRKKVNKETEDFPLHAREKPWEDEALHKGVRKIKPVGKHQGGELMSG